MLHVRLLGLLVAMGASPSTTVAQSPGDRPPVTESRLEHRRVTFVLMDSMAAPNVVAMIVRTPGPEGRDVVAVRRSGVTRKLIFAALVSVKSSVDRHGEEPQKRVTVFITANIHLPPPSDADRERVDDIGRRLLVAPPETVPGYGRRPSITVER